MNASIRCCLASSLLLPGLALAATPSAGTRAQIAQRYAELPLAFERNQGQFSEPVRYVARGAGYALYLTPDEAVLRLTARPSETTPSASDRPGPAPAQAIVRGQLLDARSDAAIEGEGLQPGRSHYLAGADPDLWHREVRQYDRVRYRGVLPGVDLVYYGNQGELEYDFILEPQADPDTIRLRYSGMERAELDAQAGELHLHTAVGVVTLRRPVIYQERGGQRIAVDGGYRLRQGPQGAEVSFQIGSYDRSHPLVIDPVVSYATYLGSRREDFAGAIAVDAEGYAYVTGHTLFADFPTTPGTLQPLPPDVTGGYDAFVTKLTPDGSQLVYSTYLGGTGFDYARGIAIDAAGSAYLTGYTASWDFPTVNPIQTYAGQGDLFVSKLSPDGSSLLYSTFVGGAASYDHGNAIAVDALGQAYVAGDTWASDFPQRNPVQPGFGGSIDACVLKLAADGSRLIYASFLGGLSSDSATGIAIDVNGAAYVVGQTRSNDFPTLNPIRSSLSNSDDPVDAFVTKLSAKGELVYSTHLGGNFEDYATAVAVDSNRRAYITGGTGSADFPVRHSLQEFRGIRSGAFVPRDAFVTRLSANGQAISYSTFLGGLEDDIAAAIALDAQGNAYITGTTKSTDFPLKKELQPFGGYFYDAFVAKIGVDGTSLPFSSYLGGNNFDFGQAIAVDGQDNIFVAGRSTGGFPTTADAFQPRQNRSKDEAFVVKISQLADSQPDVIEFSEPTFRVFENAVVARVKVNRSGTGYGGVFLRVRTTDGSAVAGQDYNSTDGNVAWSHGQTGLRSFEILVSDDGVDGEPVETVQVSLSDINGYAVIGPRSSTTLRIVEPNPGVLQFSQASLLASEGGGAVRVAVSRSGGKLGSVSLGYASRDASATTPGDYAATSGTLTWADGELGEKSFLVPIEDDLLAEGTESLELELGTPAGGALLGPRSLSSIGITDND